MTLNKNWQNEWDNIEIPHEKINLMIDETIEKMPNKNKFKLSLKSPMINFSYGVITTGVIAGLFFLFSSQSATYKTSDYTTNEALSKEVAVKSRAESKMKNESMTEADTELEEQAPAKDDNTQESKLVTEYQISKQSDSLKNDYKTLVNLVEEYQGQIVNSDLNFTADSYSYPSAYVSINIPTEKVKDFLEKLDKIGKTTMSSVNQSDVSTEYYDNESRIKALETEEKALLGILEKSDKVVDMISIQERLATVRSERESLVKSNKSLDKQVDYTTVHLSIDEVATTKPQKTDSFWERIKLSWKNQQIKLKNFGENVLVFIFSYGVYIIGIIGIGFLVIKKMKNR